MQIQEESELARTPLLEHCEFFTCVQCGYCGYLILGDSAQQLRDEEEWHARECKGHPPVALFNHYPLVGSTVSTLSTSSTLTLAFSVVCLPKHSVSYDAASLVCVLPDRKWVEPMLQTSLNGIQIELMNEEFRMSLPRLVDEAHLEQLNGYVSTNVRKRKIFGCQQRLKEISGYEWFVALSWITTLLFWGLTWWFVFKLLCSIVQLVRYVPGLLP